MGARIWGPRYSYPLVKRYDSSPSVKSVPRQRSCVPLRIRRKAVLRARPNRRRERAWQPPYGSPLLPPADKPFLSTAKTETPVCCPLPPFVIEALHAIPESTYFFWTGLSSITRLGCAHVRSSWRPMFVALGTEPQRREHGGCTKKRARVIAFKSRSEWCRRGESEFGPRLIHRNLTYSFY